MFPRERPSTSTAPANRSDADCFSPVSDQKAPALPACYRCGGNALGARVVSIESGTSSGRAAGTFRFVCGCDGDTTIALTADSMFPRWLVVSELTPGLWSLRHLTQAEAEKRVASGST